jgi:hypothetical protein
MICSNIKANGFVDVTVYILLISSIVSRYLFTINFSESSFVSLLLSLPRPAFPSLCLRQFPTIASSVFMDGQAATRPTSVS